MENCNHINEWEELSEYHKLVWISKAIKKAQRGNLAELDQALDCIDFLRGQKRFTHPNKIIYMGE